MIKSFKVYVACFAPEETKSLKTFKKTSLVSFFIKNIYLWNQEINQLVLKMMVDHFNGDYKDVVVFGDEKNDLSMFRDEWTSIAMGKCYR